MTAHGLNSGMCAVIDRAYIWERSNVQFNHQSRHLRIAVALAILLGPCAVIISQERNGSLSGTVIDSHTQAPISGLRIEIPGVGQSTSDESGRFRISNIPPGRYLLQAVQSGMAVDPQ